MCGRFFYRSDGTRYRDVDMPWPPNPFTSFNIAPGADVPILRVNCSGEREWLRMRWGLIPHWSTGKRRDWRTAQARAETVRHKPAYRIPFKRYRCLIPASGFFEWVRTPNGRQPFLVHMADRRTMMFAGLWDHWNGSDTFAGNDTR
ncbi:MAG: SOS response-associated peptidase [Gammaproteobacteria bacterium]